MSELVAMEKMKTCGKCGENKPESEFSKHKHHTDGLRSMCKSCASAVTKTWRKENPEKARAANKAWYEANLEKVRAASKAWYAANPERAKATIKAWEKANPEKVRAAQKARYAANPEKARAASRAWYAANPDKANAATKAWFAANPEKANAAYRRLGRKYTNELHPVYIAQILKIKVKDLTPHLLALKQEQLTIHRLSKQLKKALHESIQHTH